MLTTRNNVAVIYREKGRYEESERLFRTVLAQRLRSEPDGLSVANTKYHLGRMLVMARRPAEGVPFLREAEAIRLESFEKDDPRVAEVQLALGNALLALGQAREGRALVRTSLENAEKRLGAKDRMVVLGRRVR